jgi:uncharacterized protein (TIGR02186 family)
MKRHFPYALWVALLPLLAFNTSALCAGPALTLNSPPSISIGTAYNGTTIPVTGQVAAKAEVVIRFVGMARDLHMKKKGKALGLLWMNMDSLTFTNAPSVCIVESAKSLSELDACGSDSSGKRAITLGLDGLVLQMGLEPEVADKGALFQELLKLKRQEGLYSELTGKVRYRQAGADLKSFSADLPLPSRLSPGSYRLQAYALENGVVVAEQEYPVRIDLTGMAHVMYALAFNHSLLYGLLATIVAVLGGLLMAVLFGGGKGAH